MITVRQAWITGAILGRLRGRIPGTDLTVGPNTDPQGNWSNVLEVRNPEGTIVAMIAVYDADEDDDVRSR